MLDRCLNGDRLDLLTISAVGSRVAVRGQFSSGQLGRERCTRRQGKNSRKENLGLANGGHEDVVDLRLVPCSVAGSHGSTC